ncbi:SWIM zinc finger family protein [bacterium]|nr:SWIM zinc finger family protein [bacterium]
MTFSLSQEHILALAPDELSKKNGRGLARLDKWYALECNDRAAWGECQGSGKNRYQTLVEFNQLKSNCSCPSRKVPCKHALGLLLLMASQPQSFAQAAPPLWVEEWLASQRDRTFGKPTGQVMDPEAQAKRAQARQEKVNAGVAELELWLRDLMRQGFATAQVKSYRFWDEMGARLVDAQASGLARSVREMAGVPHTGALWAEGLLAQVGKLWLLLEGYKRLEDLPEGMQADIRSLVGWTQNQEELLQRSGVRDRWLVVGQHQEEDIQGQYKIQRTWLVGDRTGSSALLLDFAYGNNPLDASLDPG